MTNSNYFQWPAAMNVHDHRTMPPPRSLSPNHSSADDHDAGDLRYEHGPHHQTQACKHLPRQDQTRFSTHPLPYRDKTPWYSQRGYLSSHQPRLWHYRESAPAYSFQGGHAPRTHHQPPAVESPYYPTENMDHHQVPGSVSKKDHHHPPSPSKSKPNTPGTSMIVHPQNRRSCGDLQPLDIVCGRGAPTNFHYGNQVFRELVQDHETSYLCAKRSDKPKIAMKLLDVVKSRGARFVKRQKTSGRFTWVDIGDKGAYEKVCQALRDGAPDLRRQVMSSFSQASLREK